MRTYSYEHKHFGPYAEIMAIYPCYPSAEVAWAKIYAYHDNAQNAIKHWFELTGTGSPTSRTVWATERNSGGMVKSPDIIADRIKRMAAQKSNIHKMKYVHVIFPEQETPHKLDIQLTMATQRALSEYPQAEYYVQKIDHTIQRNTLPVSFVNRQWHAWHLMMSFLQSLHWPISTMYQQMQKLSETVIDTPITTNLWELQDVQA